MANPLHGGMDSVCMEPVHFLGVQCSKPKLPHSLLIIWNTLQSFHCDTRVISMTTNWRNLKTFLQQGSSSRGSKSSILIIPCCFTWPECNGHESKGREDGNAREWKQKSENELENTGRLRVPYCLSYPSIFPLILFTYISWGMGKLLSPTRKIMN